MTKSLNIEKLRRFERQWVEGKERGDETAKERVRLEEKDGG